MNSIENNLMKTTKSCHKKMRLLNWRLFKTKTDKEYWQLSSSNSP